MAQIQIVINADGKLAEQIPNTSNGYKYTYLKSLITRLRILKGNVNDLSDEDKAKILIRVLTAEREAANLIAELYAELNQDDIFNALTEIADEIKDILEK